MDHLCIIDLIFDYIKRKQKCMVINCMDNHHMSGTYVVPVSSDCSYPCSVDYLFKKAKEHYTSKET